MAASGAELSGTHRGLSIVATPRGEQGADTWVTNPGTLSCSTHNSQAHMEGLLGKSDVLVEGEERNRRGRGQVIQRLIKNSREEAMPGAKEGDPEDTGQEGRVQSLGTDTSFELDLIPNLPQGLGQPVLLHVAQSAAKRGLLTMQPVLGTSINICFLLAIDVPCHRSGTPFPKDLCVSSDGRKVHF